MAKAKVKFDLDGRYVIEANGVDAAIKELKKFKKEAKEICRNYDFRKDYLESKKLKRVV